MRRTKLVPGMRNCLIAAALVLGACGQKAPAPAADAAGAADVTVLRDFTLIDGQSAAPAPGSSMIINGGKIQWVGPTAQLQAPAGATTVDLTGKYVMPGLIDLHVHVGNVVDLTQNLDNYTRENVQKDLKTLASYGVTTAASMGTEQELVQDLVKEQRAGRPNVARLYTAAKGIVFKGGYGGVAPNPAPKGMPMVATPAEATAAVDAQVAAGADYIKMWIDDELKTMPKMPREISKAVIDAAHKHGKKAYAHIFYLEDAKALTEQGIDGFVHMVRDQPVDQALIDAMKAKGVVQFAETLSREASIPEYGRGGSPIFDDPFFHRALSPAALATMRSPERQKTIQSLFYWDDLPGFAAMAAANTKRLADGGVTLGFGTDSGPPGRFLGYFAHWELQILVDQVGMTPMQAIQLATGKAAAILGNNEIGVVAPGKWADLMVLDADPLANIRNSRQIRAVYVAGNKVWEPAS